VSFAKKLSTALSQEADVGVKWNTNRGSTLAPMTLMKRMNSCGDDASYIGR
jgi:hypothetical protein